MPDSRIGFTGKSKHLENKSAAVLGALEPIINIIYTVATSKLNTAKEGVGWRTQVLDDTTSFPAIGFAPANFYHVMYHFGSCSTNRLSNLLCGRRILWGHSREGAFHRQQNPRHLTPEWRMSDERTRPEFCLCQPFVRSFACLFFLIFAFVYKPTPQRLFLTFCQVFKSA